jgi:hypothetical protein
MNLWLFHAIMSAEPPLKNFHLPLPEKTYDSLRQEASRAKIPATVLAREAIDFWLRLQLRKARHEAIHAYATKTAGTTDDLDPNLEQAASEFFSAASDLD